MVWSASIARATASLGRELAPAPALAAASQSGFQALQGPLAVEVEKVLSNRAQKVEHQPPRRGLRIHLLGQGAQLDAPALEHVGGVQPGATHEKVWQVLTD